MTLKIALKLNRIIVIFSVIFLLGSWNSFGQTADLVITNAVTHHQASGQFTNFIITVRNNGPDAATNVKVTDVLTAAWNFANPANNHTASHGTLSWSGTQNRNVEWNIPYIPNGGVAILIFRATNNYNNWDNPHGFATTASITTMDQTDPNVSNNSATTASTNGSTNIHSLSLTKSVNNPTPDIGDPVQFTVALNRVSAGTDVSLQVTDKLPPGFNYQSHTVSNGTYNPLTGIWSLTEKSHYFSQNPHTLIINATVLPPTGDPDEYKNVAAIMSVTLDVDITNDLSFISFIIGAATDLAITKSVNNPTPDVNTNVVFTIVAENLGPAEATDLVVTDVLPSGYEYISSSATVGSYDENTGLWSIGNLNNGNDETLQITAKVLSTGDYVNTATIEAEESETNPSNNSDSVFVTPVFPEADIVVSMVMDNLEPLPSENVVYTITVENLGPQTALGLVVNDLLPSGFSYISNTATIGMYDQITGLWSIGDFGVSATATLQITAQMQATGEYTNTAAVSYGNDPVPGNNTVSITPINVCSGCTHTVSGGVITVNPGEVYCLASGSWSGGVTMNGGTLCIAAGATLNASYTSGTFSGTVINHGTVTAFPLSNDATHTVSIMNRGTFTSAYLQNFAGNIYNYGSMNVNDGLATLNGSMIDNYGDLTANSISFYGTTVNNYNDAQFTTTNSVNVYSGYWNNRLGGEVHFNGGNVNFTGDLDNSGYWEFERISSISSTLNNYGQMKVYNAASNISSTTYLTNDDLLEFINVPEVQYNGPMLTNNGTISITHATTGNFKMNQAINQVYNNGVIDVSGQFEQNAAGSLLVNNCTIECETFFVGNGITENSGLIWASENVSIQGTTSIVKNTSTGHIRGTNFTNSGQISGYGGFYFTGTTNMNTGGSFIGDEPNSILFYDASQTGSNIFDTPGGTVENVMRPDTMTPYDTNTYECTAPPSVAGYPPTTNPFAIILCEPETVLIPLEDYVEPHPPVNSVPFEILYNTVRLFEYDNPGNTTNNSTHLIIPGKGEFTVNTSTGLITFTPYPAFTSGVVEAEYRISNERMGDPIVYPSGRTKITIEFKDCDNKVNKLITNPMIRQRVR